MIKRVISALTAAVLLAAVPGCTPSSPSPESGRSEAASSSSSASSATPTAPTVHRESFRKADTAHERGWMFLGLWNESIGAFRCCHRDYEADNHGRVAFAEDNAMMLWAMSKDMYSWSRKNGYPQDMRDFILSLYREKDRQFYMAMYLPEGSAKDSNDFQYSKNRPEKNLDFVYKDPYVASLPLWGVVAYTAAHPEDAGREQPAYYAERIETILHNQSAAMKRSYTVSEVAFHMASCAVWAEASGKEDFRTLAKQAAEYLLTFEAEDHTLREKVGGNYANPLRHIQSVWAMHETLRALGEDAVPGLKDAFLRCRDMMKPSQNPADFCNNVGIYLTEDRRDNAGDDSQCTQLQIAYGYYYLCFDDLSSERAVHGYETTLGNREILKLGSQTTPLEGWTYDTFVTSTETSLRHTGTQEGNAMAWLVEWWHDANLPEE